MRKQLPPHLAAIVAKAEAERAEFIKLGGDPDWYQKAIEAADNAGDDNAIIYAIIPA